MASRRRLAGPATLPRPIPLGVRTRRRRPERRFNCEAESLALGCGDSAPVRARAICSSLAVSSLTLVAALPWRVLSPVPLTLPLALALALALLASSSSSSSCSSSALASVFTRVSSLPSVFTLFLLPSAPPASLAAFSFSSIVDTFEDAPLSVFTLDSGAIDDPRDNAAKVVGSGKSLTNTAASSSLVSFDSSFGLSLLVDLERRAFFAVVVVVAVVVEVVLVSLLPGAALERASVHCE
mmetsp:Transcript_10765/g.17983  ORF Transcript_10765/g.17983 Transcript_10765/m.17983 type:complete len:239 (+) Transcript_10765:82-798(+)